VAWFAPVYKTLAESWREIQRTLEPVVVARDNAEYRLDLNGGGVIDMWSLDGADTAVWRQLLFPVSDNYISLPTTTTLFAKPP
jgi:hypothetical protein